MRNHLRQCWDLYLAFLAGVSASLAYVWLGLRDAAAWSLAPPYFVIAFALFYLLGVSQRKHRPPE